MSTVPAPNGIAAFPIDAAGRVHPKVQTRAASFLIWAHGTLAARLAPLVLGSFQTPGQVVLHNAYWQELEICSLIARSTAWTFDPALPGLSARWMAAAMPMPIKPGGHPWEDLLIDISAFGHAIYGGLRPATLLPREADPQDPFAVALGVLEFESGRLIQGQIAVLKSPALAARREAAMAAVEARLAQVRQLWAEAVERA